jgi:hypothetical protein
MSSFIPLYRARESVIAFERVQSQVMLDEQSVIK